MTLQERVDSDLKEAMRAKDTRKLGVLRMLKSALKYAAIAKSGAEAELSDAEAAQVVRKQVKQRQDSIESFEKGGRAELAAKEKEELLILDAYLPQAMSSDELAKVVRETIAETGATSKAQMGGVMKALQVKVAGRADGKICPSGFAGPRRSVAGSPGSDRGEGDCCGPGRTDDFTGAPRQSRTVRPNAPLRPAARRHLGPLRQLRAGRLPDGPVRLSNIHGRARAR